MVVEVLKDSDEVFFDDVPTFFDENPIEPIRARSMLIGKAFDYQIDLI